MSIKISFHHLPPLNEFRLLFIRINLNSNFNATIKYVILSKNPTEFDMIEPNTTNIIL